jgi:hypothetical protein
MKHLTLIAVSVVVAGGLMAHPRAQGAAAQPTTPKTQAPANPAPKSPAKVTLPAAVDAAFKKAYPNATIKNVSKEKENGQDQYEVESVDGVTNRDLIYRPDGTVVEYEERIAAESVPAVVTAAIKARYPKATLGTCEKLFKNGTMNYELSLKGNKPGPGAVELTPDGKWVSPKAK